MADQATRRRWWLAGTALVDYHSRRDRVCKLRGDLHALTERVARIEGSLSGPWRPPANGSPAAPSAPPEATT